MKIRIEFTTDEKVALLNNIPDSRDTESMESTGSFGTAVYNREEQFIEVNLKSSFVKAFAQISGSIINTIKSLVGMCNMFDDTWLKDVKTEPLNKSEKEDETK